MHKTHISLNVKDLDAAVDFYRRFFQAEPAKQRPGYANFDLDDPPLKLALNESSHAGLSHLGVQVANGKTVQAAIERLEKEQMKTLTELDTDCCHAVQDKVWVSDPDGHSWEVFMVKGDVDGSRAEACGCAA